MSRRRFRIGLYTLATLSCLVAFGWFAAEVGASGARTFESAAQRVAALAAQLERREVLLRAQGESHTLTWAALGFRVDRDRTLSRVTAQRPARSWAQQWLAGFTPYESPAADAVVEWTFEPAVATAELQNWAERTRQIPRDAVVDFERRIRTPERFGRELDVAASVAAAARLVPPFDDQVELVFEQVAPAVTLEHLPAIDPRKVLARFDTDFRKKRGPRVHNIKTAAAYLDGKILGPGETLSFNRAVGPRVAERGFVDAPVIVNDVMESGMGGGVCQVATALHAAAVFGGLAIVERRSHSRPSGYASLGLDATVIDGVQDLRIRNPYDTPIYVRAYLPSRYVVRVEFLGLELAGSVEHRFWVTRRHDYSRRIVNKPELARGTFKQAQKGGFGYDTVSTVTHTHSNGERTSYRYKSKYWPVPEVLWVGPGTDARSLPPLPKGAIDPNADPGL